MALFDYSRSAATAKRLIDRFGREVTLRRPSGAAGADPWEPGADESSDLTVRAAVVDFERRLVADGTVQRGDKRFLIAASDLGDERVEPDWRIIDRGETYRLVEPLGTIEPGDTVVMYDLQGRR